MPVLPLPLKRVRAYRNKTALSVPAPAQNDCVAGVPICIEDVPATVGWRDTYRTTEPQQLKPQHQQNQNTKLRKTRTLVFAKTPVCFLPSCPHPITTTPPAHQPTNPQTNTQAHQPTNPPTTTHQPTNPPIHQPTSPRNHQTTKPSTHQPTSQTTNQPDGYHTLCPSLALFALACWGHVGYIIVRIVSGVCQTSEKP